MILGRMFAHPPPPPPKKERDLGDTPQAPGRRAPPLCTPRFQRFARGLRVKRFEVRKDVDFAV